MGWNDRYKKKANKIDKYMDRQARAFGGDNRNSVAGLVRTGTRKQLGMGSVWGTSNRIRGGKGEKKKRKADREQGLAKNKYEGRLGVYEAELVNGLSPKRLDVDIMGGEWGGNMGRSSSNPVSGMDTKGGESKLAVVGSAAGNEGGGLDIGSSKNRKYGDDGGQDRRGGIREVEGKLSSKSREQSVDGDGGYRNSPEP